jgi:hypothetical protein
MDIMGEIFIGDEKVYPISIIDSTRQLSELLLGTTTMIYKEVLPMCGDITVPTT